MEVKVVATSSVCLTMRKTSFFNHENSLTRDCILHNFCYKRSVFCYIHFQNNLFSSLLRSLDDKSKKLTLVLLTKYQKFYSVYINTEMVNITEIFHPFNLILISTYFFGFPTAMPIEVQGTPERPRRQIARAIAGF